MATPPLLISINKAVLKIFKSEKHGETLEFFFHELILSIVESIAIALLKWTILCPDPYTHHH
jgi:hypothetical protein